MTEPAARPPIPARVGALDGLRGWAALGVLIYHFTWEMFGIIYPVYRSYLAVIPTGGGALAVCTFFATSGYLLTIHRWHVDDGKRLWVQMFKRYVRLTIPIMGSVFLFYLVLQFRLVYSNPASAILDRENWLGQFGDVKPNLFHAFTYGLYRVYLIWKSQNYGPFLWTMAVQLWGSFVVLPIAYGHKALREAYTPLLFVIALMMYVYPPGAAMPIGALVALMQRDGLLFRAPPSRLESTLATIVFIGSILVSSAVIMWGKNGQMIQCVLSGVILVAAIRSRPLDYIFTRPVSKFMSKISFPIYLTQCALIISFSSWLVVVANAQGLLNEWTALAITIVSVILTLVVSWAFLPVETFATWVVKQIDRLLSRKPKPAVATSGTAPSSPLMQ
jgi:peptidoglycan/LPS O-acetylase OafA/YrhL